MTIFWNYFKKHLIKIYTNTHQIAPFKKKILWGSVRLAPMWQQSGTLLFCSCHGIAGSLVDELQI